MVALADNSGLEVAALGGAPGIHSARWGGPARDFGLAMDRVNRDVGGERRQRHGAPISPARWRWRARMAGRKVLKARFSARWSGRRVGRRGFGYDPIFVPDGESETFGEMDPSGRMRCRTAALRAFETIA